MEPAGTVRVWTIALDRPDDEVARLGAVLAPDERRRAERFVFSRDRRRFTVARGALRMILGTYLGLEPGRMAFTYGPRGKPAVEGVEFNLAHSHELALCAVAARPVGIDVEWRRPVEDVVSLARTAFSAREQEALFALPEMERLDAFFRCWTRKEAYLKARGDGLHLPLGGFDVSLERDDARLLASRIDPAEPGRWTFASFEPAPGYFGALAVEGDRVSLEVVPW
jgi:4'-phosphopantetheinyl transferase